MPLLQTKSAKKYLISLLRVAPEIISLLISQIFGSLNNIRVGTGVKISEGKYGVEVFFKALQQAQNNNGETGLHSNS